MTYHEKNGRRITLDDLRDILDGPISIPGWDDDFINYPPPLREDRMPVLLQQGFWISGDRQSDRLRMTEGSELVIGSGGDDLVHGATGRDALFGGLGNDRLFGGSGADFVDGGPGRDQLSGGLGRDTLFGGPGRDSFVLTAGDNAIDLIMDFRPGKDRLIFAGIDIDDVTYAKGVLSVDGGVIAVFKGNPMVPDDAFVLF